MTTIEEVPVPPQWKPQTTYDFRSHPDGPRGYKVGVTKYGSNVGSKRKLDDYAEQVLSLIYAGLQFAPPSAVHPQFIIAHTVASLCTTSQIERDEAQLAMRADEPPSTDSENAAPQAKRAKHNTVGVGKASGRSWKQPAQRAGTLRNPKLTSSWEKKMKEKAELSALRARRREVKEARKQAGREERERLAEIKRRKEENRAKSTVTQRVTAETARRMSKNKKLKKRLVVVQD
jgi:rRNA-processing protein CGR1